MTPIKGGFVYSNANDKRQGRAAHTNPLPYFLPRPSRSGEEAKEGAKPKLARRPDDRPTTRPTD